MAGLSFASGAGHLGGQALKKLYGPINLGNGGCFVAGTKVRIDALPVPADTEIAVAEVAKTFGSEPAEGREPSGAAPHGPTALPTGLSSSLQPPASALLPIEQVPLGSRIGALNPQTWDYDDSLPDPDRNPWSKIDLTITRDDGVVVDVQLLRPDQWILENNVFVGSAIPIHIEELDVHGTATVDALSACPDLAFGGGECVTGRFVTRQVAETVRITLADGTQLEGTPVHPIWSVDRNDFVELSELSVGERLQTASGPLAIASIETRRVPVPVYNIEVRGQHVYQVTDVGILVHNAQPCLPIVARTTSENSTLLGRNMAREGRAVSGGEAAGHIVASGGTKRQWQSAARSRAILYRYGIDINDAANGIPIGHPRPHNTMHTGRFNRSVEARLKGVVQSMSDQGYGHRATRQALRTELRSIGQEILSGSF